MLYEMMHTLLDNKNIKTHKSRHFSVLKYESWSTWISCFGQTNKPASKWHYSL